jgi:MFS transporter, putative metabolite:H+ symporter
MSRPQWRLLFQGGLGYTFDGMDAALVAFILPSATESGRASTRTVFNLLSVG